VRTRPTLIGLALAVVLIAGGCGDDDAASTPTSSRSSSTETTSTTAAQPAGSEEVAACGVSGAEDVRFPAGRDGAELHAIVAGSGTAGVVLAHQAQQDACDWAFFVPTLVDDGRLVLAFDFARDGTSDVLTDGRLDLDVQAAAAAWRARGATTVVAIGASKGGTGVVGAAALPGAGIDGVVSLSGPTAYQQTDAAATAPSVTVPALFVAAEDDHAAPEAAQTMADACGCPDPQVLIVPGARHGTELLRLDSPDTDRVTDAVLALVSQVGG
jgi:hypothetical protein